MNRRRIPLRVKLPYTALIAVMVPAYCRTCGPANFLYECDVAALVTVAGPWLESPLVLGTQAVAILVPQTAWCADRLATACGGRLVGMTGSMFNPAYPKWVRAVSAHHRWLPLLLLWAVRRVGDDRRSFGVQVVLGVALLLVCYFAFDPPGTVGGDRRAVNLKSVYGPNDGRQQTWMRPPAWLAIAVTVAVFGPFLPSHLLLRRFAPPPAASRSA